MMHDVHASCEFIPSAVEPKRSPSARIDSADDPKYKANVFSADGLGFKRAGTVTMEVDEAAETVAKME